MLRFILITLLLLPICISAQQGSGYGTGDSPKPTFNCISPAEYSVVDSQIIQNSKDLHLSTSRQATSVNFNFPMVYIGTDCNFFYISNYVDQDKTTGIQDYHCGSISYDGHTGIDHSIWPFEFYKMDNNLVKVVAAADGVVIAKSDGNFDKNCSWGGQPANYVVLQHNDGSTSWYFHLKNGSVTSIVIGSSVAAGTLLGTVGSSGISTGPHLHFEVHAGATSSTALIDPYSGNCNSLNSATRWNTQLPYAPADLLKVFTTNHLVDFNTCPITSYANENNCPHAGDTLYVYVMGSHASNNAPTINIYRPNSSKYYTATGSPVTYNSFYFYWWFIMNSSDPAGQWNVTANFGTKTCTYPFKVNSSACTTGIDVIRAEEAIHAYPSPASHLLHIDLPTSLLSASHIVLCDLMGSGVGITPLLQGSREVEMDLSTLSEGIYILQVYREGAVVGYTKVSVER